MLPGAGAGERDNYTVTKYVDGFPAVARCPEVGACPKKCGPPWLCVDVDTLVGTPRGPGNDGKGTGISP
jgi:acetoacetate decarboxylase